MTTHPDPHDEAERLYNDLYHLTNRVIVLAGERASVTDLRKLRAMQKTLRAMLEPPKKKSA